MEAEKPTVICLTLVSQTISALPCRVACSLSSNRERKRVCVMKANLRDLYSPLNITPWHTAV